MDLALIASFYRFLQVAKSVAHHLRHDVVRPAATRRNLAVPIVVTMLIKLKVPVILTRSV